MYIVASYIKSSKYTRLYKLATWVHHILCTYAILTSHQQQYGEMCSLINILSAPLHTRPRQACHNTISCTTQYTVWITASLGVHSRDKHGMLFIMTANMLHSPAQHDGGQCCRVLLWRSRQHHPAQLCLGVPWICPFCLSCSGQQISDPTSVCNYEYM